MANPSKAKGTKAETDLTRWLQGNGFPFAERRALAGTADKGDVLCCPGLIVEVKHWEKYSDGDIDAWQAETIREKANANASEAILIVRRNGKADPGSWWAWRQHRNGFWHMQLAADCFELLRLEGWGDPLD
jgi:hypothetical protein